MNTLTLPHCFWSPINLAFNERKSYATAQAFHIKVSPLEYPIFLTFTLGLFSAKFLTHLYIVLSKVAVVLKLWRTYVNYTTASVKKTVWITSQQNVFES